MAGDLQLRSGLDGRALSPALTERGLVLTEKIAPVARHYEDIAVRGPNAAHIGQLKKSLRSLYTNLETAGRAAAQVNANERSRINGSAGPEAHKVDQNFSLNSFCALMRPILSRSSSDSGTASIHSAASLMSSNG